MPEAAVNSSAPLVVRDLTRRFRGPDGRPFDAVSGASLAIERPGTLTSLIGPDGAGKTTLLRLLAGILTPDAGKIRAFGLRPDTEDPAFSHTIGFMPQRFGLYEELSVRENLRMFGRLRGLADETLEARFSDLMRLSGLAGFEERAAGRLSGGMKQKLGLSCALLARPKLLILDEPTVGVDPLSRRELWRILEAMRSDFSMTILVSTAYLDEAARADRTILLERGRIIAVDAPGRLAAAAAGRTFTARPASEHSAALSPFSRAMMRRVRATDPQSPWLDAVPAGDAVRLLACSGGADGSGRADRFCGEPPQITPRAPTLEDAYCAQVFPQAQSSCAAVRRESAPEPPSCGIGEQDAVVAESICRRFGDFTAVKNTSFRVRRGEIFGLLGPNGAGKTTTFRMLCGLLAPTSGRIRVAGADLRTARSAARLRVGYVAQKFSLYAQLSVRENLEHFGECFGVSGPELARRIEVLAAEGGLAERLPCITGELPLGAKRELALACALIHRPAILFLDEATSGADIASRRAFWRRIVALAESGTTVIVTTHFMEEAEYCDRILIQDAGRVLALGAPSEIRRSARAGTVEEAFARIVEAARESGRSPAAGGGR